MRKIKFLIIAFVSIFFCAPSFAQGTYTAASCSQSAVNAVINGPTHTAVNGDTIIIPTTGSPCTWTSGITVNGVGIDITGTGTANAGAGTFGAGTANTTLIESGTVPFFTFTGLTVSSSTAKVELLNLGTTTTGSAIFPSAIAFSGTCTTTAPYCPSVRVDNLNFTANEWGLAVDGGLIAEDNVFGVADHLSATENPSDVPFLVQVANDAWQGVGSYGDNSFASPDTFGTAQEFYIENNNVSGFRLVDDDVSAGASPGGARWVCRFNQLANIGGDGICGAHGTAWGGRFRGMRQMEVYYNTVTSANPACDYIDGILSGTAYSFSNTASVSCNGVMQADIARFVMTGAPWNSCDGTQPWDQYPWSSTTQCLDQPGRGQGAGLENATPVLVSAPGTPCTTAGQCWPNPSLDPIYEAGDVTSNNSPGVSVPSDGSSTRVLANRDYYGQVSDAAQTSATSPFNGTTGTGYGTLANRPTSCTEGVGYWATDQGNWNTYSSSQEGELFVCTATNTWTMSYEPYTYPHPLESGGGSSGNPPNPASGLTATVH